MYSATIGARRYVFADLKSLLAKASPLRSGDQLAGVAAATGEERVAAQYALADLPLAGLASWAKSGTMIMARTSKARTRMGILRRKVQISHLDCREKMR